MFELLKAFKKANNHCKVPFRHMQDGEKLGQWASNQRRLKRSDSLLKRREALLQQIGFQWDNSDNLPWEDWFNILYKYKNEHGHCRVPQKYVQDGKNLGIWVFNQRRKKKKNLLSKGREYLLDSIGFEWKIVLNPEIPSSWDENFNLLCEYKNEHGDCKVPSRYEEDGNRLGSWVCNQRRKKKMNILPKIRERQLDSVGFVWETINPKTTAWATAWANMFNVLQSFKNEYGHCNVTARYVTESGTNLGKWVQTQRMRKKNNSMPEGQMYLLEKIGFEWEIKIK